MAVDRVALITGCGSEKGIGAATARYLAATGIAVMVCDIAADGLRNSAETDAHPLTKWTGLDSLVAEIRARGGKAASTIGNISSESDSARMVAETVEAWGSLDILVNNAGAPHGLDRNDIEKVTAESWDLVMAVNVRGMFLMSRAAVAHMRQRKWGRVINMSSAAGLHASRNMTAYATSKAAMLGFTRALAMDVAPWGITVNAVCPGVIVTERTISSARLHGFANVEEGMAQRSRTIPLGRLGTADEVAAAVAYLTSDAAGYVTGQHLLLDGGKGSTPQPSVATGGNNSLGSTELGVA